ncbi:MAG: DNA mismatch endonuclease Vsr [Opitutae bacterium]|nr:DNA mismatch endonuclease Vsr [Opitutae bacterium]
MSAMERSRLMARVRQKHTSPELFVRSVLHRAGLRFTVSGPLNASLPGRPDIVLPRRKTVVFVHGCFWHRHENCPKATNPKTRKTFWSAKFRANRARDKRQTKMLAQRGWRVLVVWECETVESNRLALTRRLCRLLA